MNITSNKTMGSAFRRSAVIAAMVIMGMGGTAQAATVNLDGLTAISIDNLLLPVRTPAGDFYYDVTFVFGDAFSIYGPDLDFQFSGLDAAEFAMTEIVDAFEFNSTVPQSIGTSFADNSDVFFIPYGLDDDKALVENVNANYNDVSERWQQIAASESVLPSDPRWFAIIEPSNPVPVPAAVWLFGSALGFLGWMRRKA